MANKVHIARLLIVFSFLFTSKLSFPQYDEVKFEHITVEDGLPENSVTCILQDRLGFLWLGTQNGLVKYDGYSMTVYRPELDDTTSISGGNIRALCADHTGTIWVGTYSRGLNSLDRSTETFTRYMHISDNTNRINSNHVNSIYEDKAGRLWIGTDKGLNLLDNKTNNFRCFYFTDSSFVDETIIKSSKLIEGAILAITEDKSTGNLYIGTDYGELLTFNIKQKIFKRAEFFEGGTLKNKVGQVREFHQTRDGSIWMASSRGLVRYDQRSKELKFHQVIPSFKYNLANDFLSVVEDQNGLIWGGLLDVGLVYIDPVSQQLKRFIHDSNIANSLSSNRILSLYEDHSGILWIGSWGGGLNKWDRKKNKFKLYTHNPKNPNSLLHNIVRAIYEDPDGIIWLGTGDGLDKFNRETGIFKHYDYSLRNITNNVIRSFYRDSSGYIWIGTTRSGLARFDPVNETFTYYLHDPNDLNSLSNNTVVSICEEDERNLWIGTWGGGLNMFDKTTSRFTRFQHNSIDPGSISDGSITIVYKDRSGTLWVGTNLGGLNRFDHKTGKFISCKSLDEDKGFSTITSIYEDRQGNFWVGTDHTGIHLFDRNEGVSIDNFTEKDGLANNEVKSILEDELGNLWISTINGLSKFNPVTGTFKNYWVSDGLGGNNFWRGSLFKSLNGELFFGGSNGFIAFHPGSIKDDPVPPQVVISNVSLFNSPGEDLIFTGFISELDEIKLSYHQNDLRFDFVGLHFSESTKNRYTYILESFDQDWIDAGTQRNATYTNLDPGEYIFRVMAANRDGIWNEKEATLKIIITPPWWATWWAYILYALFILSVFTGSTRFYLNRQRLKHELSLEHEHAEKLSEIDQLKSRFFTNISHEFRTPLTLIKGPAKRIIEKAKEQKIKDDANLIHRGAEKLNRLVDQLLDLSKIEAGEMSLQATQFDMVSILKEIVLSFAPIAEKKNLTIKCNSNEEQILVYLDRDKVEKIVNNLLSNAFKFTPEFGQITTEVSKDEKMIAIRILDTGIGIPPERIDKIFDRFYQVDGSHTREQEGTGIGLALTKELVELHRGEIEVESEEGEGTTITIKFLLGQEHLKPEEIVETRAEEETKVSPEEAVLIAELDTKKEKTDIDLLVDTVKPLLLIVEDNKDVRNYVREYLENDYRILEAVDGEAGLSKSIEQIPDLIISDVMMPKMDGFELCNKLKTEERTSHIPVILLTAKATNQDKIEGLETGADDYIMKPFDAKELLVRIKNLIGQRKKLREHFLKEGIFNLDNKKITSIDRKFLNKSVLIINKHLSDSSFGVESFASEIALSRVTLHKKLIALIGEPPGELIKRIRLSKAAKLLENNTGNISEIALDVGFNNPAYFSECFKKQFGVTPSQYQHKFTNH